MRRNKLVLFKPRKNDYQKHGRLIKTLEMERESFTRPAKEIKIIPGGTTYGPYFVQRKDPHKEKVYYVSKHKVGDEYFAVEILQYLGINTPKIRMVKGSFADSPYTPIIVDKNNRILAAAKEIPGYIPMFNLLQPEKKMSLDIDKQIVITRKQQYKISGNVFSSFIAACLIDDTDFGFESYNFGMMQVGNRFYSAAIDKNDANFRSPHVNSIPWGKLPIFRSLCHDQELFMINRIAEGLKPDKSGVCDFDRIFNYPRAVITPEIAEQAEMKRDNLKRRAQEIVNIYLRRDKNCLQEFQRREGYRQKIAEKIMASFACDDDTTAQIQELIKEDLRGPYYQEYFGGKEFSARDVSNNRLLQAISTDIKHEFPSLKSIARQSKRMH